MCVCVCVGGGGGGGGGIVRVVVYDISCEVSTLCEYGWGEEGGGSGV